MDCGYNVAKPCRSFYFSHFLHYMLLLHRKQKQNQGAFTGFTYKPMVKVLRLLQIFLGFCGEASSDLFVGEC